MSDNNIMDEYLSHIWRSCDMTQGNECFHCWYLFAGGWTQTGSSSRLESSDLAEIVVFIKIILLSSGSGSDYFQY